MRYNYLTRSIHFSNAEREYAIRGIKFLAWTASLCGCGLMFVVAGMCLNIDPPNDMPNWVWNSAFVPMLVFSFGFGIYSTFAALDNLFLSATDRRRITGHRRS